MKIRRPYLHKGKAILTQMVGEIQGYMTALYFYSGFGPCPKGRM